MGSTNTAQQRGAVVVREERCSLSDRLDSAVYREDKETARAGAWSWVCRKEEWGVVVSGGRKMGNDERGPWDEFIRT